MIVRSKILAFALCALSLSVGCTARQGGIVYDDEDVPADAAAKDVPADAALDAPPPDVAPDQSADDVTPDATPDLTADLPTDVAPDLPPDVAPDLPPDVAPDLPTDVAPDAQCRTRCSGFCSDPDVDIHNCGLCGNDCTLRSGVDGTRARCVAGRCVFTGACLAGRANCSGFPDDGCEAMVNTAARCGSCTTACSDPTPNCGRMASAPGGYACTSGCVDPTPMRCGAACVDTMTDPGHCGACGVVCPPRAGGVAACVAGRCVVTCAMGSADCDGNPANGCEAMTTADARNCGACGTACPGAVPCTAGACACPAGAINCSNTCVDTQSDARNCGACGAVCPSATPYCSAGACIFAPPMRYTRSTSPLPITAFVAACGMPGATMALASIDDSSVRVPLAFSFRFWATSLTAGAMVNFCSNGFINLDGLAANSLSGTVPSTSTPNATIAAYWGDNYNRGPQCAVTIGAAPSRRQIFQWDDAYHCCGADPLVHTTYEIVLNESGPIDVLYQRMEGARSQTVGIENQTGTMGVSGCPGGTVYSCAPTTGMTVRYVPAP